MAEHCPRRRPSAACARREQVQTRSSTKRETKHSPPGLSRECSFGYLNSRTNFSNSRPKDRVQTGEIQMRRLRWLFYFLPLIIPNIALAATVTAEGCPIRAAMSPCVNMGNKYDVSDADPAMDASRHLQVYFSGDAVATPGLCGGNLIHVTNIMWRYVRERSCP